MSRKTRAEERIDEIDVSPAALSAQVELLRAERDEAVSRSDEYVLALQRERAEFMNFKRRTAEERERELGLAGEDLIRKVLVLADDFDRAIETRPAELEDDAVGRRHRRHRPQAAPAPRERGRDPGRGIAPARRSTRGSTRRS